VTDQGTRRALVHIASAFAQLGVKSRSTGYEFIADGLIPRPVHVGRRAVLPSDEIDAVIDARVAGLSDDEIRRVVERLHAKRTTGYQVIAP
jgi:prophage regulatory protein